MEGGGVGGCETRSPVGGPQDPLYTESRVQSSGELSAIRLRATRKPDAGSQLSLVSGRHQAQFNGMGMHECVLRTGWGGLQ